jgi:hypothetical protein
MPHLLPPKTALANVATELSLIDLVSGTVAPTPLPSCRTNCSSWPSPVGSHVAIHRSGQDSLTVHALPSGNEIARVKLHVSFIEPAAWSANGETFVATGRGTDGGLFVISTERRSVTYVDVAAMIGPADGASFVTSVDVDDDGRRAVVGLGRADGRAALVVVDLKTNLCESIFDGRRGWVGAVHFVGRELPSAPSVEPELDRALVALGTTVELWDLRRRKALWRTHTDSNVVQFAKRGGRVVVSHLFRGGTVLGLADGAVRRATDSLRSSDTDVVLPWTNPELVGDGSVAIEVNPDQLELTLVTADRGEALLTYTALPDDQWIIHTEAGAWDASPGASPWIRFYRGSQPVARGDAERSRSRAAIDAVLARAFP